MATTYLHSNTGTATNAKKFTLSMWIKRAKLCDSNSQRFYQGYKDGNDRFYVMFDNTSGTPDAIWIYAVTGGTIELYWTSSRRFRDTNGWYHIVFSADSTQASQGDRFKVYVNGVEETSWTKTNNPSQNIDWGNQLAQTNNTLTISGTESHSQLFDGSMSHIHFIDGTAYDASAFGSQDATTGEWKINTSPSVTYGNNGYFILKDGNSVTDQSPNTNNFTVGAGTLTKTEDCPSNVFNTFNPLDDYYEAGTFYNGNTTYQTGTASNKYGRNTSTLGMTSGKFYWEVKPVSVNTSIDYYPVIGITASQITGSQDYVGKAATDYSWSTNQDGSSTVKYNNNNDTAWGNHFALNSIVGVAVDLDNNKIYFSKDGVWQESGDPTSGSTGTGAAFTITSASSTPLGAYFPSLSNYDGTGYVKFEANFGNGYFGTTAVASAGTNASGIGIFEYAVPTGYTALSTKGLNL